MPAPGPRRQRGGEDHEGEHEQTGVGTAQRFLKLAAGDAAQGKKECQCPIPMPPAATATCRSQRLRAACGRRRRMDPVNCRTAKRIFARYHSVFTPTFRLIFRCRRVVDGSFLDPPAPVWRDGRAHPPLAEVIARAIWNDHPCDKSRQHGRDRHAVPGGLDHKIMKEIRRRTRVVGAFPDGQSCLNLAAARLRYIAGTAWSAKCYMNMRPLYQPKVMQTEAVA